MREYMRVRYLIIGAGPTGLGAARRLRELGEEDFLLVDRNPYYGGLAASFRDSGGFTWDIGGHVVFSHYDYFDRLVEEMLGEEFLEHRRIAAVRMASRWIPYPFQNNIRHLPEELQWKCIAGLLPVHRGETRPLNNFEDWCRYVFGDGIAELFMMPYNFKVWATPPREMAYHWIGERVSVVDLEQVLENLILQKDDSQWGPNRMFRFPLHGGTGRIFDRLGQSLADRIRLKTSVRSIDPDAKTAVTADGDTVAYEHLLNTGPLDLLMTELIGTEEERLREAAAGLEHNGVFVGGVGTAPAPGDDIPDGKCWMYFPEDNCPYYRLTNFHNYSPNHTPEPGQGRALMTETSFSRHKQEDLGSLMDKTIAGLVNTEFIAPDARDSVRSTWEYVADYGYPVPTLGRNPALAVLQPWLEARSIYSRGRFGGWKYEVANMDHSVMQGVEWAERVVTGKEETTYRQEP